MDGGTSSLSRVSPESHRTTYTTSSDAFTPQTQGLCSLLPPAPLLVVLSVHLFGVLTQSVIVVVVDL